MAAVAAAALGLGMFVCWGQPAEARAGGGHGGGGEGVATATGGFSSPRTHVGTGAFAGGTALSQSSPLSDIAGAALFLGLLAAFRRRSLPLLFIGIDNSTGRNLRFWRDRRLKQRLCRCYCEVQKAWSAREPAQAADYMSEGLVEEHQRSLAAMMAGGERNIVKQVRVTGIQAVYVSPDENDLRVLMSASMIDYHLNKDGRIIEGSRFARERVREGWRFIRRDGSWVADRINSDVPE